ncbi:MAG: phosphotransferase [Rhodobacteraceae bacterium]|nr:phosphotransferase [Paracoccaceae bacterium]
MTENAIERTAGLSCFTDPQDIKPLSGGITNVNLTVTDQGRKYVVRIGADIEEHGVMRWNELALSQAAAKGGFSPEVVHHEDGVLVLEFLEAGTFGEEDVRKPENLHRIVALIHDVHTQMGRYLIKPVMAFWPYQVNRTYITRLLAAGSKYQGMFDELTAQSEMLEQATGAVELVIGHNDLLAANILDDGDRLWLIDWEYGGFNAPLFDLAGLASNNGLGETQERQMLEQYFAASADDHWRPYQAMKCASLMRETLWSMTSEIHSALDFDYAQYTSENLDRLNAALSDFANT